MVIARTFARINNIRILIHTSQKIHRVSIIKPNRLMSFREKTIIYSENYEKHLMQNLLMLTQVVHIVTLGFGGLSGSSSI
jgi:hypothetical protein